MQFQFNEEQLTIQKAARDFAQKECLPGVIERDDKQKFPKEQVMKLAKTSIIQRAWKYGKRPVLHGWVYGLKDGIIKSIYDINPGSTTDLNQIYQYDDL